MGMQTRRHRMANLVFMPLILVAGCVMVDERRDTAPVPAYATCRSDQQCGEGLVCHHTAQVCTVENPMILTGWLRTVPPSEEYRAIEEHSERLQWDSRDPLDIQLRNPIRIAGRLLFEDLPQSGTLDASIVAVAEGEIPGIRLHREARSPRMAVSLSNPAPSFELWVTEGISYDIYIHLYSAELPELPPVHVRRSFLSDPDLADPYRISWEIPMPRLDEFLTLEGTLIAAGEDPRPLVGAKVVAFSAVSGGLSSTGISDHEGRFLLRVQPPGEPEGEPFVLRIRPTQENPVVPQVDLLELWLAHSQNLDVLLVPGLSRLSDVTLLVMDESGIFLPDELTGTSARFSSVIKGGLLEVEKPLSSDGSVRLELPPGPYVLTVIPPESAPLGIHQELLHVPAEGEQKVFPVTLRRKLRLEGWVQDPPGRNVSGARVMATFVGKGLYPETSPLGIRRTDSLTDQNGHYKLHLDPGQYTLQVDPPEGSGLPRTVIPNVYISTNHQRTLTFRDPVVIEGRIYGVPLPRAPSSDGGDSEEPAPYGVQPASGVRVEFFGDIAGRSSLGAVLPIPLGVARTDATGRYHLILPSQDW